MSLSLCLHPSHFPDSWERDRERLLGLFHNGSLRTTPKPHSRKPVNSSLDGCVIGLCEDTFSLIAFEISADPDWEYPSFLLVLHLVVRSYYFGCTHTFPMHWIVYHYLIAPHSLTECLAGFYQAIVLLSVFSLPLISPPSIHLIKCCQLNLSIIHF